MIAVAILVPLLALWVFGMASARATDSIVRHLSAYDANLAAGPTEALSDGLGSGSPFVRYSVSSGGTPMGDVYVVEIPNRTGRGWLQQSALTKPILSVGVYIDRALVIRQCWLISPARTAMAPDVNNMLRGYDDATIFDVVLGQDALSGAKRADDSMASVVRSAMKSLCASVYIEQRGIDSYRKLVASQDVETLDVGKPFPAFQVKAIDGQTISSTLLKGKKTVIVATNPPCASCFDATVAIFKKADTLSKGKWNLVLLVLADEKLDRTTALIAATPKDKRVIADPAFRLASAIYMLHSPYVAMIDAAGIVTYKGSGYETAAVMAALQSLALAGK